MKKFASMLVIAAFLLTLGSPAAAQADVLEGSAGSSLEITEDGKLIYGGDIAYECESVGSGIVMAAENSSPQTRAELERTNEQAIKLCTEAGFPPAGFPPAGTGDGALPDTGGASLAAFAAVGVVTGYVWIRSRVVR